MKKRFLSIILSLALCMSLMPTAVFAGSTEHSNHCICGETHTAVGDHTAEITKNWTAWSSTNETIPNFV